MKSPHSTLLVIAVSCLGGLLGSVFVVIIHFFEKILGPHAHGGLEHVATMVIVGALVAGLKFWVGNPGDINMLVDNIHVSGGRADIRELRSLIPISILCISSGGAMGPEAPLVQSTGAIGTAIGKGKNLSVTQIRVLTISGMATGFALLFGTPIGAAIFALELMHRRGFEYYEALMPAMIGALIGYFVNAGIVGFGLSPIWNIGTIENILASDIAWGVVAGILGAGLGAIFVALVKFQKRVFEKFPDWFPPILGGLSLGLLGMWNSYALTYGEEQVTDLFSSSFVPATLIVAGVVKLIASSLTLSSGWKGGFIIPLFFVGAAFGHAVPSTMPGLSQSLVMSLAMMVSINTSVTKTPIGSALVVSGMCGVSALAPCLAAGIVSLYLSDSLVLFPAQRARMM